MEYCIIATKIHRELARSASTVLGGTHIRRLSVTALSAFTPVFLRDSTGSKGNFGSPTHNAPIIRSPIRAICSSIGSTSYNTYVLFSNDFSNPALLMPKI